MEMQKIKELVSQMTLEEKASLCSGLDFWHTKPIERLGVPSEMVSDGPHGLRKQEDAADHLGLNESIKAVCFPAGCATASGFNRELATKLGETLGEECQAENISTILGPAMNIKRSPLCGRNFEYYSEDPLVSTEIAGALVHGVQSKHVGTSPKHFMANNQEYNRLYNSSEMDERTMREIYLASFEGMVKKEKPWTIMNSYNKLNGTYLCEHKEMLTDILRNEWGFDGYVMTDWGAMNERVDALKAGCNLEMPSCGGTTDAEIVAAVREGTLDEAVLDQSCEEFLNIIFRYEENRDKEAVFDREKDHEMARRAAEECMVLLKNEDAILPLAADQKVAFIGKYAKSPRYQGGGSSHVNSFKVESALDALKMLEMEPAGAALGVSVRVAAEVEHSSTSGDAVKESEKNQSVSAGADMDAAKDGNNIQVTYAQGFDDAEDKIDEALIAEAVETAKNADVAVIFAGLPDSFESEGYDRKHMRMPDCQNALIEAVAAAQPNTVVVLHNGSPIEMPWIGKVKAVLETYLGGEAVGGAVVRVLYGLINPSGHLAETFPLRLQDTPCYLTYGVEPDQAVYAEGVFVGYRYYTSKEMEVLFPFGHGLSYTTFAYSNLRADVETSFNSAKEQDVSASETLRVDGDKVSLNETENLIVTVDVTNTGTVAGKEVVQLYVSPKDSKVIRPVRELRAFDKIELAPGETKTVSFTLGKRAFAFWDAQNHDWKVESGAYEIQIGKNAQEIVLSSEVSVTGICNTRKVFTLNSTLGEIMRDPKGQAVFGQAMAAMGQDQASGENQPSGNGQAADEDQTSGSDQQVGEAQAETAISDEMMTAMMDGMPLRKLISFVPGLTKDALQQLVMALNA